MVDTIKPRLSDQISEEVQNELIDVLPTFLRTMNLVKLVGDTMTEETISGLTQKAEKSADLLNFLGDERIINLLTVLVNHADQLTELIGVMDRLVVLQKNGTLDRLFELAETLGVVTEAMTEPAIQHMTKQGLTLIEVGDRLASSSLIENAPKMIDVYEKTVEDTKNKGYQPTISAFGLLKLMKEKEVQDMIHFGLAFLKNMRSHK